MVYTVYNIPGLGKGPGLSGPVSRLNFKSGPGYRFKIKFVSGSKKAGSPGPLPSPGIYRAKKTQKYVFLEAGLRKIMELKNKETLNSVRFLFYIYVTRDKSTAYAKFAKKKTKNHLKFL